MINSVTLTGRLVRDPEMRYTGSGIAVANMRIAVDRKFKNAQGERETDFFDLVAWRKTAELASNYMSKGQLIGVEGRLQSRNWETQEGQKRTSIEVVVDNLVFLESRRDGGQAGGDAPPIPDDASAPPADDFSDNDPWSEQ